MIHSVSSSLPSFKSLRFHEGLNILAAVKTQGASERQTRNSAGKTSFVEIVHFLLGASLAKDSLFKTEELKDHSFELVFDLGGKRTKVRRSCADPTWVIVEDGDTTSWPVQPTRVRATGDLRIKNQDWRRALGRLVFGLTGEPEGDVESSRGEPSFRQMFPYFARRQLDGGFENPVKNFSQQKTGSVQVSLTSLLGLDWSVPKALQDVRDREKGLHQLKKAVGEGTLGGFIGRSAELRKEAALLEDRVVRLRKDLGEFRVVAEYHELEQEASETTRALNALADEDVLDAQIRQGLEEALKHERTGSIRADSLDRLYKEAGVVLPAATLRRFEDVQGFHESVVANRKSYLDGEIRAAEQRIAGRAAKMEQLNGRLAEIMRILSTARALDQFSELQGELSRREAELAAVRGRLQAAEQLESDKARLGIERGSIFLRLKRDHQEQSTRVNDAIVTFEQVSSALYENAGSFSIGESDNGPVFDLKIQGDRGKGVRHMQMFCFDMMLMKLVTGRHCGPRFLIHDSHLFDPVEERQRNTALRVGAEWADRYGFQYIVTMNEDSLPKTCPPGFDLQKYLLPVKLTDETETGGLFGFRFD